MTADALHDGSRGYAGVDGRHPATGAVAARSILRVPGRVHLMAPARWRCGDSSASRPPAAPIMLPAPAQWMRSRRASGRPPPRAPQPQAQRWLLPPMWPLDDWHAVLAASRRRFAGWRVLPWMRARLLKRFGWASVQRRRLVAGVAVSAVASVALVLLRFGMAHHDAGSRPVSETRAAPAKPISAMRTAALPARPAPPKIAAVSTDAPSISPPGRPGVVKAERRLLSEVSTMDLMMPVEEPDLDITSRDSLWSQVGQSTGVDPLLLYAIALVESKALYPDGKVAPTPWLFRVNDHLVRGDRHDVQLAMAAASQFGSAVQDVGIMQVYYPMHRDAVRDPLTLLNPRTNITVAAKILRDGMRQTRDRVLGVGYYHSHTPSRARDYGSAVLTVYQRLQAIHRPARRARTVAR
jgi:hypothetical protein